MKPPRLNLNNKTITKQELFDVFTRIVAHPHTVITEHDKIRAGMLFNALEEYNSFHMECQEDCGCWINDGEHLDFQEYITLNLTREQLKDVLGDEEETELMVKTHEWKS